MSTFRIYGSSDDLIEIEGIKGAGEFNIVGAHDLIAGFVLSAAGGQLCIYAIYAAGCWVFAPGPVDEDVPIPAWPIRSELHSNGYSSVLEIDVPDDATVFRRALS